MTPEDFETHRPHLFAVAYRLLGSASEAEDVVQEAFLRARDAEPDNARGFLVTVVTRLALDVLKSARVRRESYVGPWLPEPVRDVEADPLDELARRETLSFAFLQMAERLTPVERAVIVLHDAFGAPFAEIGPIVEKSEANSRQIHRRARAKLGESPRRPPPPKAEQERILVAFLVAVQTGDLEGLKALLAEDIVAESDGGGVTTAARVPILGADRVAKFVLGLKRTFPGEVHATFEPVNGELGLLIWSGDQLLNVNLYEFEAGRIKRSRTVVNPEKLAFLRRQLA